MNVLLAPQISEKATYVAEKNEQVIFRVASDATKPEVKAAVEMMFNVNVETACRLATSRVSKSVSAAIWARRKDWKKAYVCLAPVRKSTLLQASRGKYMALIKLKPTSPGRRAVVRVVTPELHKGKPDASLLEKKDQNRRT